MNWWALRRKIHISWLLSISCFGALIGVFLSQYHHISSGPCLLIGILLLSFGLLKGNLYFVPIIIISSLMIGLFRGSTVSDDISEIENYYGQTVEITGRVGDDPDIGTSGQIVVRLSDLLINNAKISASIWVSTSGSEIKRGDELIIQGKLTKGFGNFAGKIYQARTIKIIHPIPGDIARQFRDWFTANIKKSIKSEPESSLGIGYLVGQRQLLPADFILALQAAGLTHVVVASGYNLTILVRLARRLFQKTSKYLSVLSAGLMIIAFVSITGISPSMSRAGLVSALSLLAWYYGRKFHPVILISIAMATTVMINPGYIWGDLGWQLSFAAFAGVLILAPLMTRYFFGKEKLGIIKQILIETVSAQIMTAPIVIISFGQISNVAIIANLLILPLVPLAMLFTFIAGLCAALLPFAAGIISLPATWLLSYMVKVTNFFAELPWAITEYNFGVTGMIIFYLLVLIFCIYLSRITKYNLRDVNLVE